MAVTSLEYSSSTLPRKSHLAPPGSRTPSGKMAKQSEKSREGGGIPRPQGTNGSPSKLAVRTNPSKVNIKPSPTTITAKHQPVTRTVSSEINKNTSSQPGQHSSDAYMAKLDQARVAYGRGGQRTLVNDKLYPRVPPPGPQLFHPGPQRSQTLSMIPSHSRSKMAAAAKTPGMAGNARVSSPPMAGEPVSRMPVPSQYTGGIQPPPGNQNTGLPLKGIMKTRLSSDIPSSSSAPTQSHSAAQVAQYQVPHGGIVGNPTHQIGHPSQQNPHSSSQQMVHSAHPGNHQIQQNAHLLQQGNHPPHQNSHPLNHGVIQLQGSHPSQQGVHPSHQGSHPHQTIGHHSQQAGHPTQQTVHLSQQSGHPIQQAGHPNQQVGHPTQQGNYPSQQGNHSQQGSHPNQSHPTSQSGPSHSTGHMQPLSLPNQSSGSHPSMNQGPPQQQQQRPAPLNQGPLQQHQGPPQQGSLYQGSSLQHQAPLHQHQGSLSQHLGPPQPSHSGHQFHPMNSQHGGFKGTEQGQARGPLHNGTSFAGPKGLTHSTKHIPSSSYPVNSHTVQFGSLQSHPTNSTAHATHSNHPVHPTQTPSNNHPNHLTHQPTNPLSVHPNHPPHPTPPPYQQPPPPTVSNNEINAIKEPTETLSNVMPSQNELLKRLHSAKNENTENVDYSKKVKDSINDLQNIKDLNARLTEDNQELRDLCCFLDDDRQKGRKLAREWQRFGRYTASVMRQEVSNYQSKLKMLEAKQQELIKDNLELKELCLYLDEERSGGGLCTDCGGPCSVVPLPVPGLQAIRDEGDGSSSSTNNDESEVSSGRLVDGLSSPDAMFFSELKMQKLGLSDEVLSYIRNLEERISATEGGREFVENRIIHDNSMDDVNNLKDNNRPEAVTNAMKVLEVHEHVLEKSLDSDDTQDELGDGEKALVREMCNVVWRKLEEG